MKETLLERINSPEDLKKLAADGLTALAAEVRAKIISTVEANGGHLGPNLGVVELTLALHSVLESPKDRIIWDVGHQCYTHKLITGRLENFHTLRQWGGISGFPALKESEHDHFGVGHSSTSISAAAGMVIARDLLGEDYNVVAVIGDGALTGGMAFEALNHIGSLGKDLIVILNDNEMSITSNVGALSDYLSRVRSDTTLYRAREDLMALIRRIPAIGGTLTKLTNTFKRALKSMLPGQLFEELGFAYFGPFDGHNIHKMQKAIQAGISRGGPVLIHAYTQKGRGHASAEQNPAQYHGVGPLNSKPKKEISFSQVFGDTLVSLGENHPEIVAITAAMRDGTGLGKFAEKFPTRFFDVGIAEQHALTLAAGMAKEGLRPFVALYSTFLQRGYDQVIHDIALQKLPVVIGIDRAGVVGDDGPTHHGVFDISFLRAIPGLTILAPKDGSDLCAMLNWALRQNSPVAIRYPRGVTTACFGREEIPRQDNVSAVLEKEGADCVILAVGQMVEQSLAAAELLAPEIDCAVVNVRSLKPLDQKLILKLAQTVDVVVTVEDHVLAGGFGTSVLELLNRRVAVPVERLGYPDEFIPHGSIAKIQEHYGLTARGIAERVRALILSRPRAVGRE